MEAVCFHARDSEEFPVTQEGTRCWAGSVHVGPFRSLAERHDGGFETGKRLIKRMSEQFPAEKLRVVKPSSAAQGGLIEELRLPPTSDVNVRISLTSTRSGVVKTAQESRIF